MNRPLAALALICLIAGCSEPAPPPKPIVLNEPSATPATPRVQVSEVSFTLEWDRFIAGLARFAEVAERQPEDAAELARARREALTSRETLDEVAAAAGRDEFLRVAMFRLDDVWDIMDAAIDSSTDGDKPAVRRIARRIGYALEETEYLVRTWEDPDAALASQE